MNNLEFLQELEKKLYNKEITIEDVFAFIAQALKNIEDDKTSFEQIS